MLSRICLTLLMLIISSAIGTAQDDTCRFREPFKTKKFQGQLLYQTGPYLFSFRLAEVSIGNQKNQFSNKEVMPDEQGRFEFAGLKPGKYYLTVYSDVGDVEDLEFEIVSDRDSDIADDRVEIIFRGDEKPCEIRTVKNYRGRNLTGSTIFPFRDDISEITLIQRGCFGTCPMARITLRKDGTAIYVGKGYTPRIGMFKGETEFEFYPLAELFYRQGFFNLKNEYKSLASEGSGIIFTVVRNGQSKTVKTDGFAPIELWGMKLAVEAVAREIEWTEFLPVSELANTDLRRIAYITPQGRVQDNTFNQAPTLKVLTLVGSASIPFLIGQLDDETKLGHHVKNYWSEMRVGDLALIILTDLFTRANRKDVTVPGIAWDKFLERGESYDLTDEEVLRRYIRQNGRVRIKERWQSIWNKNKDRIYWDRAEKCFKLKSEELPIPDRHNFF